MFGDSQHYGKHVKEGRCKQSKLRGPFLPTTIAGIRQATSHRLGVADGSPALRSSSHDISLCMVYPNFTWNHIKNHGVSTAQAIHGPALELIKDITTDLFKRSMSLSCTIYVAAMDTVSLFPALVFYPHDAGASKSQVRTEARNVGFNFGMREALHFGSLDMHGLTRQGIHKGHNGTPKLYPHSECTDPQRAVLHGGKAREFT